MLPPKPTINHKQQTRNNKYEYRRTERTMAERSKMVINEILSKENDELRKKFERITGLDRLGSTEREE
ncbi:MAG: hypothetical protein MUE99_06105 [Chitinophagaceae bacterium]|nr:hypothetical protein [Chitinophagaceae bacterium]